MYYIIKNIGNNMKCEICKKENKEKICKECLKETGYSSVKEALSYMRLLEAVLNVK